jgi:hypothetical protein
MDLLPEAIVFQQERDFDAKFTTKEQHLNFTACHSKHAPS